MAMRGPMALALHVMVAPSRTMTRQHASHAHLDGLAMQVCAVSVLRDQSHRRTDWRVRHALQGLPAQVASVTDVRMALAPTKRRQHAYNVMLCLLAQLGYVRFALMAKHQQTTELRV